MSAGLLLGHGAAIAQYSWRGTTPSWTHAANWKAPTFPPGTPATVSFGPYDNPVTMVQISEPVFVSEIRFEARAPSYTIGLKGGDIRLERNGFVTVDADVEGIQTIGAKLWLDEVSSRGAFITNASKLHSLRINGGIGTSNASALRFSGPGTIEMNGIVQGGEESRISLNIFTRVIFTARGIYWNNVSIGAGGTVVLGDSEVLDRQSMLVLDGGTLSTNGFDQFMDVLTSYKNSIIDFGDGQSDLAFGSYGKFYGKLTLMNFDVDIDTLRFGTDSSALSPELLRLIDLPGYSASLDENGYVKFTPVPEPSAVGMLVLGVGFLCLLADRRFALLAGTIALLAVHAGISHAASVPDIELLNKKIIKADNGMPLVIDANIQAEQVGGRIEVPRPNIRNLDPLNPIIIKGTVWQRAASGRSGSNGVLKVSGPGWVEFLGVIDSGNLAYLDFYIQDGRVSLSGNNRYSGKTKVTASTLRMDASNVLSDRSSLILQDGKLETSGFDDIMPELWIRGASLIDFGFGESSLWFQKADFLDAASSLTLLNFDIGKDSLRFGENGDSLRKERLALIHLDGYEASLSDEGYVQFTAVPEPSHVGLAGMALFLAICMRRKAARQMRC